MNFANGMFDFGFQEGLLHIIRIIATIMAAIAGWFICDPLTRVSYRMMYEGAAPGAMLFSVKGCGAALLAVVTYLYLPLAGGGGGLGYGPGPGGNPGQGEGQGGKGAGANEDTKDKALAKDKKDDLKNAAPVVEAVEIVIINSNRSEDVVKERFYLVKGKEPPQSEEQLKAYFTENFGKIKIIPILPRDSFDDSQKDQPMHPWFKLIARRTTTRSKSCKSKKDRRIPRLRIGFTFGNNTSMATPNLLLFGTPGAGKSALLAAVVRAAPALKADLVDETEILQHYHVKPDAGADPFFNDVAVLDSSGKSALEMLQAEEPFKQAHPMRQTILAADVVVIAVDVSAPKKRCTRISARSPAG